MRVVTTNGVRTNRATWLRRIRIARHFTQAELAETVGVSTTAISHYEKGIDDPSLEVLDRLLVALGCWYVDLLANSDAPLPPRRLMHRPMETAVASSIQLVIDEFARPSHRPEQYPDKFRCFTCHGRPGECQCHLICKVCGLPFPRKQKCSGLLHHPTNRAAPRAAVC